MASTLDAHSPARAIAPSIQVYIYVTGALILLRLAAAAFLPLSFDEAYFWLWSKHLAVSYYDHPPLIALATWLGTSVFGDTEFGVRAVSCVVSIAASWAVWRAGAILLDDEASGGLACCFFNATLMIASQGMAATPDSLVLGAAAFLLLATAKLEQSDDGRWWLAIGAALGAALLAKYTAFFLCAGVFLWFAGTTRGRRWLGSPWPYLAALIAIGCFVPNLLWNAAHDWISFKFQFGRVVSGAPGMQYLLEFIGGQIALASPFIFVLAIAGLVRETRLRPATRSAAIAAAIMWPAIFYFTIHALHSRVQGNWPSFVYAALAVLAAAAAKQAHGALMKASRLLALPFALLILTASYAQAWTGVLPLGIFDPVARMTAVDFAPVADDISALARRHRARAIVTADYAATGWLSFYLRPHLPVLQISEEYRWLQTPRADSATLRSPLLFVTRRPRAELPLIAAHFAHVKFEAALARMRAGVRVDTFYVYSLSGFHGAAVGRMPNAQND
jgi:4-amino-4-deoxy-L-arabinose transferase-like glycosyltransferase